MKSIRFKEFLESRNQLYEAYDRTPVISETYIMDKYCKIPMALGDTEVEYISLKPKDSIIIEWEYHDFENPSANSITINDTEYKPVWNNKKMGRWVKNNTLKRWQVDD